MSPETHIVRVFASEDGRGGNPAPIVVDASGLSSADMQDVARRHGLESGFVLPAADGTDLSLRFFVPNHEMEMCGHATIGAVWLLDHLGRLPAATVTVATPSGRVEARIAHEDGRSRVEISQPTGQVEAIDDGCLGDVLATLAISRADVVGPVVNARTSRTKTLVPIRNVDILDAITPDAAGVEPTCDRLGSTGLYPFAAVDPSRREFAARQFPRGSGYLEDPATGIAASALAFGLLADGRVSPTDAPIVVRQGVAMGRPSRILVRFRPEGHHVAGCWLGGAAVLDR